MNHMYSLGNIDLFAPGAEETMRNHLIPQVIATQPHTWYNLNVVKYREEIFQLRLYLSVR